MTGHDGVDSDAPTLPERDPERPERTEKLGPLAIVGSLGAGGMGEVLEVVDDDLGRRLAAKVIRGVADERARGKFLREARVTGQLEHPNIVPVHGLGRAADGELFFTMKRIRGEDLAGVIGGWRRAPAPLGPTDLTQLLGIFLKVCDAVGFAHDQGVVHRDLKPANVMVGAHGEVLVMDWGLARITGATADEDAGATLDLGPGEGPLQTLDGTVVGTPAYMPPEQAAGRLTEVDARSDVYSLGAILYELLTLEAPYVGATAWAVLAAVADGELTPPVERAPERAVPPELDAIVRKAMSVDAAERYADVLALRADIEAFLAGRLVGAASYGAWERVRRFARRHRAALTLTVAVAITAVVVGAREPLRRQRLLSEARAELARQKADVLLDRAEAASERVPAALRERRYAPSIGQRKTLGKLLDRLQRLAEHHAAVLRWAPDDRAARAGLRRTLRATATVAGLAREEALADAALRRALPLGDEDGETARQQRQLATLREQVRQRQRTMVATLLERARKGTLDARGYVDAVALLASFRDQYTLSTLATRLNEVSDAMLAAERDALMRASRLTRQERASGLRALDGLESALPAWFALARLPGGTRPTSDQLALVDQAHVRLEVRATYVEARIIEEKRRPAQLLIAEAQARVIPGVLAGGQELRLLCDALGRLGGGRLAVDALGRYLLADRDPLRVEIAAMVLAERAARADRRAIAVLDHAFGPPGLRTRWKRSGSLWHQITRRYQPAIAIPESDDSAHAHIARADALLSRGKAREAIAELDAAIARDPKHARSWSERARARLMVGEYAAALADAERSIALDSRDAISYQVRSFARGSTGDLPGALLDAERAVALAPRHPNSYIARAVAHARARRREAAIADFGLALNYEPHNTKALTERGTLRLEMGQYDRAFAAFDLVLRARPDDRRALSERGRAHLKRSDLRGAMEDFQRAIAIRPTAATLHNRGDLWLRRGDRTAAMADYDRALKLDPRYAPSIIGRANVLRERDELAAAIAECNRALAIGKHWYAYAARAGILLRRGDTPAAIRDYSKAIDIAPKEEHLWQMRGVARMSGGDYDGALRDLLRAIEIRPTSLNNYNIGALYQHRGEEKKAVDAFARSIALDPHHARAFRSRGISRSRLGDRAGIDDVTRAIKLDPGNAQFYLERGILLYKYEKYPQALKDVDRSLQIVETAMARSRRGAILHELKRHDEAAVEYRRAIAMGLKDFRVHGNLARLLARAGKRDEAAGVIREAMGFATARQRQLLEGLLRQIERR